MRMEDGRKSKMGALARSKDPHLKNNICSPSRAEYSEDPRAVQVSQFFYSFFFNFVAYDSGIARMEPKRVPWLAQMTPPRK
jgi:hypothetical protein